MELLFKFKNCEITYMFIIYRLCIAIDVEFSCELEFYIANQVGIVYVTVL